MQGLDSNKDQARWTWTAVMLVIKIASNIFVTSAYVCFPSEPLPSLQQDICYVKASVQGNWNQLFLSVTYSKLIGERAWHLFLHFFIYVSLIYSRVTAKYPREKNWTQEIYTKKLRTHEIITRKNFGPTKARRHDGTRHTRPSIAQDPQNLVHS